MKVPNDKINFLSDNSVRRESTRKMFGAVWLQILVATLYTRKH